jgi:RNA polymerase primary sigma factor
MGQKWASAQEHGRLVKARRNKVSDTFETYLKGIARYDLLAQPDEYAALSRIAELTRERWNLLLRGSASHVQRWLDSPASRVPQHEETVAEMRKAWHPELGARACTSLVKRLQPIDPDHRLAEALIDAIAATNAATPDPHNDAVLDVSRRLNHARNMFACANLRLVVCVAKLYSDVGLSLEDRIQEGNFGLMTAVNRFDCSRGVRFSTYGTWWIRHAIGRAVMNRGRTVRIPSGLHLLYMKSRRVQHQLATKLAREPSLEEVATAMDIPADRLRKATQAMMTRAVEMPEYDDMDPFMVLHPELVADGADRDATIDDRRNAEVARSALGVLSPIEREIIMARFGMFGRDEMTLALVGEQHALSRERIRQLQNRALEKMRAQIERSSVPSALYA